MVQLLSKFFLDQRVMGYLYIMVLTTIQNYLMYVKNLKDILNERT